MPRHGGRQPGQDQAYPQPRFRRSTGPPVGEAERTLGPPVAAPPGAGGDHGPQVRRRHEAEPQQAVQRGHGRHQIQPVRQIPGGARGRGPRIPIDGLQVTLVDRGPVELDAVRWV